MIIYIAQKATKIFWSAGTMTDLDFSKLLSRLECRMVELTDLFLIHDEGRQRDPPPQKLQGTSAPVLAKSISSASSTSSSSRRTPRLSACCEKHNYTQAAHTGQQDMTFKLLPSTFATEVQDLLNLVQDLLRFIHTIVGVVRLMCSQ